jgi:hypothetical protein
MVLDTVTFRKYCNIVHFPVLQELIKQLCLLMYDISCSVHQVLFFPNYIESSWRPPPEAVLILFLVQLCMCYTEVYTPTKCCCCFWCLLLLGVLQNVILPGICKLLHDTQCLSNVHRQIMHSTGWYLLFFLWMAHGETTSPRYGY